MSERTVTVRLRALITDYQKAMQTAAGESRTFAQTVKGNFAQLNQDVGELGETMTRRVTVPLVGIGLGATKLASDFETVFAQMVGLAGVASSEIDGLRDSVISLSQTTARGPTELAQALYFIRSSGIDAAHAMGVLEVAAKASAAGLGSTVTIADAVTSAMNAYGAANLSAQKATDVLGAAVREGKTEASELAPVLGVLIPTAAAMGISFDQVAGTLAVMSRTGLDAAEASTSLNAIFSTLLGTSKEGTDTLTTAGLSLGGLRDMAAGPGGLVSVMRLLDGTFKGNDEALARIIPNVRAFRGVMNVLAQDAGSVDQVMQSVANSAGATDDAFAAIKDTWAFKLKQAVVDLEIAMVKLGELVGPMLAVLATGASAAAAAFAELPQWLQRVVVSLGLIAVVAGPALKIFSVLAGPAVSAIKLIITQLVAMRTAIIASQTAGASYAASLTNVLGSAGIAVGAVAVIALGATAIWKKYADRKREAAQNTRDFVAALKEEADAVASGETPDVPRPRIAVNQKLFEGDLGTELREAGADMAFFTDVVLTGSDALKGFAAVAGTPAYAQLLIDKLRAAAKGGDELATQLLALQAATGISDGDLARLVTRLNNLQGSFKGAGKEVDNERYALQQAGVATEKKTDTTQALADAEIAAARAAAAHAAELASEGAAAAAAEKELRALLGALNAVYSGSFDVLDAQQGFADALSDVDSATRSSGGSARDLTSQQRSLEDATKGVTEAQEGLAEAEKALDLVRKGATPRQKQDAALDVRDAKSGVTSATKALADAKKRLAEEQKKGVKGDAAGARINVEQADIALIRAKLRLTDAQANQNKVNQEGKEGSESLKKATDDLEDAQDRLRDATERQTDAEAQMRSEGGSGGPVADRARQLRGAYDRLVESAQGWITKLIEQKRPTGEILAALDEQTVSAQKLIDTYGDPEGKLQRFIDQQDAIRRLFADQKFKEDAKLIAKAVGVIVTGTGVIIDMGGGDDDSTAGRAHGGPVGAGATVRINEQGDEFLSMGSKPGYVTTAAQMSRIDLSPIGGTSAGMSNTYNVSVRVGGSVMVDDLDKIVTRAVSDAARRTGGIPYAGRR